MEALPFLFPILPIVNSLLQPRDVNGNCLTPYDQPASSVVLAPRARECAASICSNCDRLIVEPFSLEQRSETLRMAQSVLDWIICVPNCREAVVGCSSESDH